MPQNRYLPPVLNLKIFELLRHFNVKNILIHLLFGSDYTSSNTKLYYFEVESQQYHMGHALYIQWNPLFHLS